MLKYICPRCTKSDYELIGGLEDEGGGNLRDDYRCKICSREWSSSDMYVEKIEVEIGTI